MNPPASSGWDVKPSDGHVPSAPKFQAQVISGRLRIQLNDVLTRKTVSRETQETTGQRPVPPVPPRRKAKLLTFPEHDVSLRYASYPADSDRPKYFMTFYRKDGKRIRESRASFAALKKRAAEIALNIANGKTEMNEFGQDDRATFLCCQKLAASVGVPLQVLVAQAVEAIKKNSRTTFVPKNCPELCAALLAVKLKEGECGKKWLQTLKGYLKNFSTHFTGPLHLVRTPDFNAWLRALPGGLVYRRHHRGAALELVNFARAGNFLPDDWEEFKLVENPEPRKVTIKIWTPEELVKLLAHTHSNMLPFTALQAFAGLRHEELRPSVVDRRKVPLDWRDVDFEQGHINVNEETGKTGARLVPMTENLIAWLKPHARSSGPVCPVIKPSGSLTRAKRRAGLAAGKNESRNILRKSFGSYRLAVVKHIGQVADEMGNSPAKIKSNYRKPRPEKEGKRWFNIWPTNAEILQLNLAGV